jgi:surface protein
VSTYDCASNVIVNLPPPVIYFDNGICKCPNATVGDTEVISGITYTAVDNTTIRMEIAANNVNLCTTQVTNMSSLFQSNATFNSDIGFWDTSNVTDMSFMFYVASSFNQDIGNWDTSNVITMRYMFFRCRDFNQDIGNWDTSSVVNMFSMLRDLPSFNQDLSSWNVLGVIECSRALDTFTLNWTLPKPNFTNCTP